MLGVSAPTRETPEGEEHEGIRMRCLPRRVVAALCSCLLLSGCMTRGLDMPVGLRLAAEVYLGFGAITGKLFPSRPDLPAGLEGQVVRDLGEITAVGLTVDDANGDIYVAASHRQGHGVSDNRFKPYWLLDDLAAEHVDDRLAYIEKWAGLGKDPLSWYSEKPDLVLRLRQADGDVAAEGLNEFAAFAEPLDGIGSSVLVDDGNVWFTSLPNLWRLRDADGDGRADERESIARGFGVATSLAGHDLHGLVHGPDGRIYFSVGDRGYNVETREGRTLRRRWSSRAARSSGCGPTARSSRSSRPGCATRRISPSTTTATSSPATTTATARTRRASST